MIAPVLTALLARSCWRRPLIGDGKPHVVLAATHDGELVDLLQDTTPSVISAMPSDPKVWCSTVA